MYVKKKNLMCVGIVFLYTDYVDYDKFWYLIIIIKSRNTSMELPMPTFISLLK